MAVTGKKEKTFAVSDNSLSSLLLGRSGWIIEEDNFGKNIVKLLVKAGLGPLRFNHI